MWLSLLAMACGAASELEALKARHPEFRVYEVEAGDAVRSGERDGTPVSVLSDGASTWMQVRYLPHREFTRQQLQNELRTRVEARGYEFEGSRVDGDILIFKNEHALAPATPLTMQHAL